MGLNTIGVMISAHTPRVNNGMVARALTSVLAQERAPDAIAVAIDHDGVGAAATKQRALEMLDTDWVCVLDSDDELLPHHIRIHEEAISTGADLIYSWFHGTDPFPEWFFTDPWDDENPRHTTTTIMARRGMMLKVGYSADPAVGAVYADDDWRMTTGLIDLGAKVHHIADRSWIWHNGHGGNTSGLAKNWRQDG